MGGPPVAVANSKIPQGSLIYDFSCCLPKNPGTLCLKALGVPSSPHITITKKINFCSYNKNDVADQDKWEVDSYG